MYNLSGGTAGKELRKEIAAGTEISLGGMNQEGMTREEAIPEVPKRDRSVWTFDRRDTNRL